jgi:cytochrome c-type biogenesis protein CcmH/NrfG
VRVLAADANDSQTYLLLVQYATAAGDTRTAKLAATKAVDLAPKSQRKEVQKAAKQLQTAAPQQQ